MSWGKIDDQAHSHPKIVGAGKEHLGPWFRMISWSNCHGTDGRIPREIAESFSAPGAAETIARLLAVRLLDPDGTNYQIHDFLHWNRSAAQVRVSRENLARGRRRGAEASAAARGNDGRFGKHRSPTAGPSGPRAVKTTAGPSGPGADRERYGSIVHDPTPTEKPTSSTAGPSGEITTGPSGPTSSDRSTPAGTSGPSADRRADRSRSAPSPSPIQDPPTPATTAVDVPAARSALDGAGDGRAQRMGHPKAQHPSPDPQPLSDAVLDPPPLPPDPDPDPPGGSHFRLEGSPRQRGTNPRARGHECSACDWRAPQTVFRNHPTAGWLAAACRGCVTDPYAAPTLDGHQLRLPELATWNAGHWVALGLTPAGSMRPADAKRWIAAAATSAADFRKSAATRSTTPPPTPHTCDACSESRPGLRFQARNGSWIAGRCACAYAHPYATDKPNLGLRPVPPATGDGWVGLSGTPVASSDARAQDTWVDAALKVARAPAHEPATPPAA